MFGLAILTCLGLLTTYVWPKVNIPIPLKFEGTRALKDIEAQINFGARLPGSNAHKKTIEYIQAELVNAGWQSAIYSNEINGHNALNILATRNNTGPVILLGAHYDSRLFADDDPEIAKRSLPVLGANDGASGVAVLLEIARTLPLNSVPVSLLFIDIEDNGNIPGWDWILGSRAFAANMDFEPKAVIILDMIGDADLNIYKEMNSDSVLTTQIWGVAFKLGYEKAFIPTAKYRVLDDQIPFIEKGIPTVDIIDIDYPYHHTTHDTLDKVSSASLQLVGDTLLAWIDQFGLCLKAANCPG